MKFFLVSVLCLSSFSLILADDSNSQNVAKANNDFTFNLYNRIKNGLKNVIASPFSVSTVLSMLLVGARTETADEIKTALDYVGLEQDQINKGYKSIIPELAGQYTLQLSNAIFVNKSLEIGPDFNNTLTNYYNAASYQLDDANGAQQINNFVDSSTNHEISQLFDSLPTDTQLVLVNAIYFKGDWKIKFNPDLSAQQPFHNEDGTTASTTLMHVTENYKYIDSSDLDAKILLMPYKGETMYMVFLLPNQESQPLSGTEAKLTGSSFVGAINSAEDAKVIVTIPKFKSESDFDLGQPLMDAGMQLAFTDDADFSGISNTTAIKVTKVVQKALIEVDENGSVAAAATGVVGGRAIPSAPQPEPETFIADRPFLYALYHKPTNSILFVGRYVTAS